MNDLFARLDALSDNDVALVQGYARVKLCHQSGIRIARSSGQAAADFLIACDSLDRFSLVRIIGYTRHPIAA
ncbi:hypothetical protein [Lacipirellula parvula]|uniref:Uncharacterized protein n=1 Tax=Lacipirellula parvula TaxID=2650471 RepID=A0A5K7XK03_9BACT|nr:hypothetical protein [Lacipirellula parvula]BBO34583.1 hypothetical protein PLANPX_4195 [Lacipirellula parvula]